MQPADFDAAQIRHAAVKNYLSGYDFRRVSARSSFSLSVQLVKGITVMWDFCTERRDIKFEVAYIDTEKRIKWSRGDKSIPYESWIKVVVPAKRVSSHCRVQYGHWTLPENFPNSGKLRLVFDNNFSKINTKKLFFMVSCVGPKQTTSLRFADRMLSKAPHISAAIDRCHLLWEEASDLRYRRKRSKSDKKVMELYNSLRALSPQDRGEMWLLDSRSRYLFSHWPEKGGLRSTYAHLLAKANAGQLSKSAKKAVVKDVKAFQRFVKRNVEGHDVGAQWYEGIGEGLESEDGKTGLLAFCPKVANVLLAFAMYRQLVANVVKRASGQDGSDEDGQLYG